jgi:hypothetical protein
MSEQMLPQIKQALEYFHKLFYDKIAYQDDQNNLCHRFQCWIAGGAVRDYFSQGYCSSDLDLYSQIRKSLEKAKQWMINDGAIILFENQNAIKISWRKLKLDLITYFFEDMAQCIETFDFTVCCAAINYGEVVTHQTFWMDLAKRRLVINKVTFPLSTMWRMHKYIKKVTLPAWV